MLNQKKKDFFFFCTINVYDNFALLFFICLVFSLSRTRTQADYILICFDAVRFFVFLRCCLDSWEDCGKKCKFEKMELLLEIYLSSDLWGILWGNDMVLFLRKWYLLAFMTLVRTINLWKELRGGWFVFFLWRLLNIKFLYFSIEF